MAMCHPSGILNNGKGYPFVNFCTTPHNTRKVSEEDLAPVDGGPSGIPLIQAIQKYVASFGR